MTNRMGGGAGGMPPLYAGRHARRTPWHPEPMSQPDADRPDPPVPYRQVRAVWDARSITVYQAYGPAIAGPAVAAGRFVPPFSRSRMTWVKPSFLWMMYRSGWATKPGQERILAVTMSRSGFEEALGRSCLSHMDPAVHNDREQWVALKARSPVRIQWDPERDTSLNPLPYRSLQVGIGPGAVDDYVDHWVLALRDITDEVARLRALPRVTAADLPQERPYPLPDALVARIGATPAPPAGAP